MKKFMNDPKIFVPGMLDSIVRANPDTLKHVRDYNLIMRADALSNNRVIFLQGSGSGHAPAHVMTVGPGMLTGSCPGNVFTAPPMDYVYESARLLNSEKGALLFVNTYTGDRMAWEMAKEMLDAEGIKTEITYVDDDVAIQDSTCTVGRRGVANNFFVMKTACALAEAGTDLAEVKAMADKTNSLVRTMGIALSGSTPPAKGEPIFTLADDEMEAGVGIHGQPGRRRDKMASADAIVDELLGAVVPDLPFESGDEVALMINSLGGTPISEQYLLYGIAHRKLEEKGIKVWRSYVGEYCTSLKIAGISHAPQG